MSVPGPKGHLLTGNLFDYTQDHLDFLTQCAREYLDVVRLRFINVQIYLLNHPDNIEYVAGSKQPQLHQQQGVYGIASVSWVTAF